MKWNEKELQVIGLLKEIKKTDMWRSEQTKIIFDYYNSTGIWAKQYSNTCPPCVASVCGDLFQHFGIV
ncbi:hypothetical protein UFOVP182_2 [uncultured Caudovirales phage]|uniref:Uncharacterized protein n=1 Tax=uncultured Caudovirales phage TaxID=2100421 RepID=A0A6J7WGZ0_9CAUD|nr:hypothetical protein UFOVP182_2 [uncultured Caudovirales phage]